MEEQKIKRTSGLEPIFGGSEKSSIKPMALVRLLQLEGVEITRNRW